MSDIETERLRAVVFDLDGTLLTTDLRVPAESLDVLARLRARGLRICIASGRSLEACAPFRDLLQVTTPLVCYNGAAVFDPATGEAISEVVLDEDIAREIIRQARHHGIHLHAFRKGRLLYESENNLIDAYQRRIGFAGSQVDFDELEPLSFTKAMFIGSEEIIRGKIRPTLMEQFGDRLEQVSSLPGYYEMMNGSASKDKALSVVMRELGIAPEEVIAFGDGHNDIGMLTWAGYGVAMWHASGEVLDCTPYRTEHTNDEQGATRYLDRLFGLGVFS